jgi:hypothetical protein
VNKALHSCNCSFVTSEPNPPRDSSYASHFPGGNCNPVFCGPSFDSPTPTASYSGHLAHLDSGFLATMMGSLTISAEATSSVPQAARSSDRYIMEAILALPKISASMQPGSTLLSEITTADGKLLATDAWRGDRLRHSPLLWPYQPPPGPASLRIWQCLLKHAFMSDGRLPWASNLHPKLQLTTPLGQWLPGLSWLQSKWTTFYSYGDHHLYWQDKTDHFRFSTHSFLQGRMNLEVG